MILCKNCGIKPVKKRAKSDIWKRNACSWKCRTELAKKNRVILKCKFCNKTFNVVPARRKTAKFCSISCTAKFTNSREYPPHWNGGVGIYRRFKKSNCERCNSENKLLVHHKDHNRLNNSIDNLETLCYRCHMVHHNCISHLGKYAFKIHQDEIRKCPICNITFKCAPYYKKKTCGRKCGGKLANIRFS